MDIANVSKLLELLGDRILEVLEEKGYGTLDTHHVVHLDNTCERFHKDEGPPALSKYIGSCACARDLMEKPGNISLWKDLSVMQASAYLPQEFLYVFPKGARTLVDTLYYISTTYNTLCKAIAESPIEEALQDAANPILVEVIETLAAVNKVPAVREYLVFYLIGSSGPEGAVRDALLTAQGSAALHHTETSGLYLYTAFDAEDCMEERVLRVPLEEQEKLTKKSLEAALVLCQDDIPLADALATACAL